MLLENSTILITGGSAGIGEALAKQLAHNNTVIICGRNEGKLKAVASYHNNIHYVIADISDHHSIEKLFAALKEQGIVLNVLFNNAGVAELWDVQKKKLTAKEIFEKVNTNLSGAVVTIQYFIKQANIAGEQLIVNMTSEITIMPVPIMPLYSASKSGLSVFTKSIQQQFKGSRFKVVEILAPGVDTNMSRQLNNKGKLLKADDFASDIISQIKKGRVRYAPGVNAFLLTFFSRVFPGTGLYLIDKLSRKQLSAGSARPEAISS